ncbi:hypothetical protein ACQPUY_08045 [Clostridium nigeriense]|uniref:hypothetical protein n=1 Tax=Clostridium nigeriense TaxID=1805470 RepID=UPI003D329E27
MKMKKSWIGICVFVMIIMTIILVIEGQSSEEEQIQKVVTVIQEEEFQFYCDIVQKEYKGTDEEELYKKAKKYAEEVYAQFALGTEYRLCKPYSYESLKMDVEAENQQRKTKNDEGEVVYGVLEYSMDGYLRYTLNNLKLKTVDYLVKSHDRDLEKEAKKYLDKNPDKFETVEKIEYHLGDEIKTISRAELPTLEKTNSELFEYLYNGKEGDTFSIVLNEEIIDGEIISKELNVIDFGKDKAAVLRTYISDVYYGQLVDRMTEANPLEFELNKE